MSAMPPQDRLTRVVIRPNLSIREAIGSLDVAGTGALLLSADGKRLSGLLTDGDVRRAILRGVSLEGPCGSIATARPLCGRPEMTAPEMLAMMNEADINQLPIAAEDGTLFGLVLRRDLAPAEASGMSAVIMAGGMGTRLMPLTADTPKPMLPVGDRPLLERTIERLREAGIVQLSVATHHLAERITEHFGDGQRFGVSIQYLTEEKPLGTAGGLGLLGQADGPILVINGDILTRVDFRDMLAYHRRHHADVTVGVRRYEIDVPYGVVECDGAQVQGIREKPSFGFLVNAGIYLLEPSVPRDIPAETRFDMTDLIARLIAAGRRVVSFPIVEYWLDVGRHDDYRRANEDAAVGEKG
jgi:dTDP-glucose pyrophosphorylase